jgi:Peptidase M50B-like
VVPRDRVDDVFILYRFDNWKVNTFVPPLLLAFVWLIHQTPLKFLLQGFHVWVHEFGHATAAWLCGFRATPLPIGWTPVEPVYSPFVYWGLLLMFGILFVAGAKERKVWPMIAALALAGLQYYMTWRMPAHRQEFWWGAFGGVGGEFYLSTLFMMSFWVQLPEKFKWAMGRYVFFAIGATAFLNIWIFWGDVYRGIEEIPFGSMIHGEEDEGGDMNKLVDGYGWKKFTIRRTYWLLGWWCWLALGVMWAIFALRLNKVADWAWGKLAKEEEASG